MAVTAATLTTTVSESVTLNGKTFGNSITKTHASIKVVREQIVTVPNGSEVALYNAADSGAGVTFDEDLIKYARITNTDTTNFINLILETTAGDEFQYRVDAGTSFILSNHTNVFDATAAGADVTPGSGYSPINNVTAKADTAAVDVEIFVAATG